MPRTAIFISCLLVAGIAPAGPREPGERAEPAEPAEPVEQDSREALRAGLEAKVDEIAASVNGVVGVTILDLATGDRLSVRGDMVFAQASAIKLPLLVELMRQVEEGKYHLDDSVTLEASDMVPGSGVLQHLTPGKVTLTLRDVITLMVTLSDNTATNLIIDRAGMDAVNATMKRLGLTDTRLQRKMMDDDAWRADRENLSTPNEQARLLQLLYHGDVLSDESRAEILRILEIPKPGQIRSLLPPGTKVAHKTGGLPGVVVDVGIVFLEGRPFVVSAMANWVVDEAEAERAIAETSLVAYRYFDRLRSSNSYGHR
jgi:beta-lactamase class A